MSGEDGTDRVDHGINSTTTPHTPPSLQYAPPALFKGRPSAVDWIPLTLGLAQLAVATLVFVQRVLLPRGHYELREPTWATWLAWQASGGQWMLWAWVLGSLIAVLGASLPPGHRRRWYFSFAAMWFASVLACIAGLAVLDGAVDVRERWVVTYYGAADPQYWKSIVVEPDFYFHRPILMTVANPMIVLLALRFAQGRAAEGVAVRSG